MTDLKNLVLYAGTDKHSFAKIKKSLVEGNRSVVITFSIIATIAMLCMTIASYLSPTLSLYRVCYVSCLIASPIILLLALFPAKKLDGLVYFTQYLFIAVLLLFGISLGTFIDPNEATVSFVILLFAVPLVFTDAPWRIALSIVIGIVVYTIAAKATQDDYHFFYNMASLIPYGLISLVSSVYMMTIKVSRLVLEMRNRYLSESDQLTGLLNRNSYEDHLHGVREGKTNRITLVCAFDVNGLKLVNDNLGHQAGDELIKGAADCINAVFSPYGKVYRVGGDEFMVLIEGSSPSGDELWKELEKRAKCWKGTMVSGLSIAMGNARPEGNESIEDTIRRADKVMYDYKKAYYDVNSLERRLH